jgi:hypothetical protein
MNTVKLTRSGPADDTQLAMPSYTDPDTGIETIEVTATRLNPMLGLAIGVAAILAALYFLGESD